MVDNELAEVFVSCGLLFNDEVKVPSSMKRLQDLKVDNTKTCLEWICF